MANDETFKEAKPLKSTLGDWKRATGNLIQLCVVEELDPEATHAAEALTIFGGFALCREHFEKVTDMIKDGIPMGMVVNKMMTVGLDSENPDQE